MMRLTVAVLVALVAYTAASSADKPTQVHLAQAQASGCCGMVVTWMTTTTSDGSVNYGTSKTSLTQSAAQTSPAESYNFVSKYIPGTYTSPLIHHVTLSDLKPSTKYYYEIVGGGGAKSSVFSFTTPPAPGPEVPFVLSLVGDLGQTNNSQATMSHVMADPTHMMTLLVGDLSYADSAWDPSSRNCTQRRWDSWGEIMEPAFANMPLMALPGNHEVEQDGALPATQTQFLAFQKRFKMPSEASGARNGNLYYSFDVASAHIIHLNSYMDFNETSAQYAWLMKDLAAVDRSKTPWLIVNMHAPWYNSNQHHHDEMEEVAMKAALETKLHSFNVDIVFAGHVHAYERMHPTYKNQTTPGAVTYINIGDAGNREGPCPEYFAQPSWSAYREAAFGHGRFEIFNSTHAHWTWHRIQDPEPTVGDEVWLVRNRDGPGVSAIGKGNSATQYDGYAFMLNQQ